MTRRGFFRTLFGAAAVITVAPEVLSQACMAAVSPATNPIFSGEIGLWHGLRFHEISGINEDLLGGPPPAGRSSALVALAALRCDKGEVFTFSRHPSLTADLIASDDEDE